MGYGAVSRGSSGGGNDEFVNADLAAFRPVYAGGGSLVQPVRPVQQSAVNDWKDG